MIYLAQTKWSYRVGVTYTVASSINDHFSTYVVQRE